MSRTTEVLLTSVLLATGTTVIVFGAPILPALAGGIGAGLLLRRAERRRAGAATK